MTHRNDAARGVDVLGRWRVLAEQRLQHLTELFESGRWRRYHSEQSFLENIREAKLAVETWRGLSAPGVLSPPPVAAARSILPCALAPAPAITAEAIEMPVPETSELVVAVADQTPPVAAVDLWVLERALDAPDLALDLGAIERRYPLLRNRM